MALGHRRNAKHRVERHRFRLIDRTPSERAFVNNAAIVGRDRDQTRNETRFYWLPQDFIDSHFELAPMTAYGGKRSYSISGAGPGRMLLCGRVCVV